MSLLITHPVLSRCLAGEGRGAQSPNTISHSLGWRPALGTKLTTRPAVFPIMSNESMITIEIRGRENAALEAVHRISGLFLSSGPCRLRRTPGEDEVQVLVHADVARAVGEGGYRDPDAPEGAGSFLR